jgi:histidinol-phosphate phosphatase family protein
MRHVANPTVRQAAVLVGGLGTRLGDLTAATPKPLLNCDDRPFLAWLLRELCRFGVEEVLLLTGHLADTVEAALPAISASLPQPLRIACVREQQQAGTGGALFQARDHFAERFLLCNGDSWLDFNLSRLLADAADDPKDVVGRMVLRRLDDASRYGVAEIEGDRITGFRERPEAGQPATINAGVYLLDRRVLDAATPVCSLERDILPKLAAKGVLRGTVTDGYFIDIGIPTDLARAQTELPARLRRRALFLDRNAVFNVDHDWDGRGEHFEFVPGALSTITAASDAGWHVFVVTNQPSIAEGLFGETQVAELCRRMADVIRAEGGTVDDLRYRPLHSDVPLSGNQGVSDWWKPEPGMLLDLLSSWQLDSTRCVFISDQPNDLAAAAAAGIPAHLFLGHDLEHFHPDCAR